MLAVVDARVAVPELAQSWPNPPIRHRRAFGSSARLCLAHRADLLRPDQQRVEKNWAHLGLPAFVGADHDRWHVQIAPQTIVALDGEDMSAMSVAADADRCLERLLGHSAEGWKLHHATGFIAVTLCRRGECVPTAENSRLFGVFHLKRAHPTRYVPHVLTLDAAAPHRIRSLSPALEYGGLGQSYTFATTLAWTRPRTEHGLSHGFLDDEVLLSMGVGDKTGALVQVRAEQFLGGHLLC